jgi:hypothetical protein
MNECLVKLDWKTCQHVPARQLEKYAHAQQLRYILEENMKNY